MPFIVSVGNIAMGGTGKTPFTIFLAKHFTGHGEKVSILSRGYKGGLGYSTHVISDGSEIFFHPPMAADEPYMMARALPGVSVITGKDRIASFKYALERYNPSVFILDDAFQHKKMRRDLNIVLLDHKKPVSTGFPFPFGYLREFPSAIKRANIVVFTRADSTELPKEAAKYCAGKPVFFAEFFYSGIVTAEGCLSVEGVAGKSVWLMSAIAGNERFAEQMKSLYVKVLGHDKFMDHHLFTEKEILSVLDKADREGAELIVVTHKDYVKIPAGYASRFAYPEMDVRILNQGFFEEVERFK